MFKQYDIKRKLRETIGHNCLRSTVARLIQKILSRFLTTHYFATNDRFQIEWQILQLNDDPLRPKLDYPLSEIQPRTFLTTPQQPRVPLHSTRGYYSLSLTGLELRQLIA